MGNRLLDAATTLLGWINHTATDQDERLIAAGTTVKLSTPLDAADGFTFVASHPGHTDAVTFTLEDPIFAGPLGLPDADGAPQPRTEPVGARFLVSDSHVR